MYKQFEVAAPFSHEIFNDICTRWLVCNSDVWMPCSMNTEKQLIFEKDPPKYGFFVFLHSEYGLLKTKFSLEKNIAYLSQPKLAHRKERSAFRCSCGSKLLEDKINLVNLSEGGCLLQYKAKLGTVLPLHFKLKRRIEVIAFCVHETDENSGWSFQAWKFTDESKYRLALGEPIPPLAQELQQISADRARLVAKFERCR